MSDLAKNNNGCGTNGNGANGTETTGKTGATASFYASAA